MTVALGLLVLSDVACAFATVKSPGAAFYWLPFRAWELGLGSFGALLVKRDAERVKRVAHSLLWPAMLALVAIPIHPLSQLHPGPDALIVCAATLAIILCDRVEIWRNAGPRVLATVGDASYSLYLVHWPILAFAANAWVGPNDGMPVWLRVSCLVLALGLGFASYRFVELPVRRRALRPSKRLVMGVAMASMLLVAIPVTSVRRGRSGGVDYDTVFRFDPFLCDATHCVTQIDSTILYRDHGHLSRAGSRLIAARVSLTDSLVRQAR